MAAAPGERHASPSEFARALVGALGGARQAAVAPAPTPPASAEPAAEPGEEPAAPEPADSAPPRPAEPTRRAAAPRPRRVSAGVRRALALALAVAACAGIGLAVGSAGGSEPAPAPKPRAAPSPPPSAVAAAAAVDSLGARRAALRRRLNRAETRAGQAEMATLLSRLHGRAARRAGAAPAVRAALLDAAAAYLRMAKVARTRRGKSSAWSSSRAAAQRADTALRRALAEAGEAR
jgi:hypothetical protein